MRSVHVAVRLCGRSVPFRSGERALSRARCKARRRCSCFPGVGSSTVREVAFHCLCGAPPLSLWYASCVRAVLVHSWRGRDPVSARSSSSVHAVLVHPSRGALPLSARCSSTVREVLFHCPRGALPLSARCSSTFRSVPFHLSRRAHPVSARSFFGACGLPFAFCWPALPPSCTLEGASRQRVRTRKGRRCSITTDGVLFGWSFGRLSGWGARSLRCRALRARRARHRLLSSRPLRLCRGRLRTGCL